MITSRLHRKVTHVMKNLLKTWKYIWENKKGKPRLYIRLKKALYGMLQAALLFWQLLSDTLQEWGFKLNPYNKCMANKKINGKQCTIIWHIEDLKILDMEKKVVDDIIGHLSIKFGKEETLPSTSKKYSNTPE